MTISIWWLLAIVPLSASIGFFTAALCNMAKASDEHIKLLAQAMREEEANEDKP